MKNLRSFLFALFLGCFAPVLAYSQGIFIPARNVFGTTNGITRPIAGATVTVCAANTAGIPCSPALANTVFKDSGLTVPLANPFTTDANGNYPQAALAGGIYTITESASGFTGFSYQVTISCAPGAGCTVGAFTATNATITGVLTASGTGVYTNTQMNNFATVTLNGLNYSTEYSTAGSHGGFDTEALASGVAVPNTSTVIQASGGAFYANNSSTATNAVGVYSQCRSLVASGSGNCWGGNALVASTTGQATVLYGTELDVNANNVGDQGAALQLNGAFGAQPTKFRAIWVNPPGSGKNWTQGLIFETAATPESIDATHAAIILNPAGTGNGHASQGMEFVSIDGGGVTRNTSILQTNTGNYTILNPNGSYTLFAGGINQFAGGLQLPEGSAPAASANNDICYGDSTLHAIKCSYNNGTFFQIPQVITATSSAFATATTAGTCVQNTTAVTGAATTMAVAVSPVSTPGVGAQWSAFVSSAGNVTINECAVATSAGGSIAFNIRVIP